MHHPTDSITHTMAFVTPVVEHWLEREIAMKDRSATHRTMNERSYDGATSRSCPFKSLKRNNWHPCFFSPKMKYNSIF